MKSDLIERWQRWVRGIGAPLVVPCDIDIDVTGRGVYPYICLTHGFGFYREERQRGDRCPVSRLEEWRAHRWEATA